MTPQISLSCPCFKLLPNFKFIAAPGRVPEMQGGAFCGAEGDGARGFPAQIGYLKGTL
jgi:hypothetical protein